MFYAVLLTALEVGNVNPRKGQSTYIEMGDRW